MTATVTNQRQFVKARSLGVLGQFKTLVSGVDDFGADVEVAANPPMNNMKTLGFPGTIAPRYQELALGKGSPPRAG